MWKNARWLQNKVRFLRFINYLYYVSLSYISWDKKIYSYLVFSEFTFRRNCGVVEINAELMNVEADGVWIYLPRALMGYVVNTTK
jgi:hypothetical protein